MLYPKRTVTGKFQGINRAIGKNNARVVFEGKPYGSGYFIDGKISKVNADELEIGSEYTFDMTRVYDPALEKRVRYVKNKILDKKE